MSSKSVSCPFCVSEGISDIFYLQARKVPCPCATCNGRLVSSREVKAHQARELRRLSMQRPVQAGPSLMTFSAYAQQQAAIACPPHLNQSAPTSGPILGTHTATAASEAYHPAPPAFQLAYHNPAPPVASPPPAATENMQHPEVDEITLAEHRGLEHLQRVLSSGEDFDPLSRDDSDLDDEEMSTDESEHDLPVPSETIEIQVFMIGFILPGLSAKVFLQTGSESTSTISTPTEANPPPADLVSTPVPEPDPFQYTPAASTSNPPPDPANFHPSGIFIYVIYMLVFWLHSQCHLSFRACNAVLACFAIVLRAAGVIVEPDLYLTLPSVMTSLGADPTFQICPVCPTCQQVYPPSIVATATCCSKPLFDTTPTVAEQRRGRSTREKPKPLLQFPFKSLEDQLTTVLSNIAVEEEIEQSINKVKASIPGVYNNIFDGKVCKELKCKDGTLFFSPSDEVKASGELRIGVTLGVDW